MLKDGELLGIVLTACVAYEAEHGARPTHVYVNPDDAAALVEYVRDLFQGAEDVKPPTHIRTEGIQGLTLGLDWREDAGVPMGTCRLERRFTALVADV